MIETYVSFLLRLQKYTFYSENLISEARKCRDAIYCTEQKVETRFIASE